MKQFLVPALLLAVVGTAAAIAVNGAPAPAVPAAENHASSGTPAMCPVSAPSHGVATVAGPAAFAAESAADEVECTEASAECTEAAAAKSAEAAAIRKSCEDKQDLDCCKKKMECGDCKKDEPAQKP